MRDTELVTADRLRVSDTIVAFGGERFGLMAVDHDTEGVVKLRSWQRWFTVPLSCKFVRVRRDRRINTRPDLKGNQ